MTNIQILDNDFEIIQKYIALGREKFNLTIRVERDIETPAKREYRLLSNKIDKEIRNAKSINTEKAKKIKYAMEELNKLLNADNKHISLAEAKEQYFTNKAN